MSETSNNDNGGDGGGSSSSSDSESYDDEIEPKLKYQRLSNDLQKILLTSTITCICVHSKFLCIGTHWGYIYLLDHQGNSIENHELLHSHTVSINHISIDQSGEYIATCSDDGKILIHSLFTKENNIQLNIGRLIKTISLDPLYSKYGINRRFIIGDDKLTLYERTFLGNLRSTILCNSEGLIKNLCWGENFIAWSNNIGVRVYDIKSKCSLGLIKWEQTNNLTIDKFRCNLCWSDQRTLLIGWIDTVRVCCIRKRNNYEFVNRDLPEFIVDPITTFQTEFFISGIAPLEQQLVILGCSKHYDKNNKSLRPQLYIIEYHDNDYTDICTDSLSLRGYEEYQCNDYHLNVLIDENRFFIVAPKDIVIASPYDLDDRIQWFIQHNKYEDALNILIENQDNDNNNCRQQQQQPQQQQQQQIYKHTIQSVGVDYLDYLLNKEMYDDAGKLCLKIFGKNTTIWEDQIYKFASVHQLRSVCPYIPRTIDCKLNPHIYEMILYEFLKLDSKGFLKLVKEWNSELYNICAVINAVLEHLLICENDKNIYLEALAILYSYQKRYDKSLSMYLKLKHKDVFALIQTHNLYGVIQDMLLDLMDLDYEQTIQLLLEKNTISSDKIVERLRSNELHLYRYLDAYDKKNPKGKYHKELVRLYSIFAREKLLPFLKKSDHYPIQDALDICQKEKFYPEMVYLLGRIGDTKIALELIINQLNDMEYAIEFCQEHDDTELWNDLINYSLNKPEFITFLLQTISTYVDPTVLVQKIANDLHVPGLKQSLIKMLQQYNLQVSVQDGCKKILVADYFNLLKKLVRTQQKGISICDETMCGACHRLIIDRDLIRNNNLTNITVFNCKHVFHQDCLPETFKQCGICYPD